MVISRMEQAVFAILLIPTIAATQVTFSHSGTYEVYLEQRLSFSCRGPANHIIDILEIGQPSTIENMDKLGKPVSGNVSHGYYPKSCSADENRTNCTKVMNITVTASMHGKSYQCLSYDRDLHPMYYYSKGGYMIVKDIGNDCLTSASIGTTNVEVLPTTTSSLPYPSPSSTTAKVMRSPTATLAPTSNPTPVTTDVVASSVLGLQPLQVAIPLILLCTFFI